MDESSLQAIGLTKSEVKVYMALLELGKSTTGPIVDKSEASSSKIYEILERLIKKGLASVVNEKGAKHFEAAPPSRILEYLKEKKTLLEKQTKSVEQILPELELKQLMSKHKTETTVYRGMKGLENAFRDSAKKNTKKHTNYVFFVGKMDEYMVNFFSKLYRQRGELGIKTKTIYTETGRALYESRKNFKNAEGKVLPTTSPSPATVNIMGNEVILRIGGSKNVIAIRIENKDLANSFLDQFQSLWNQKVRTYTGKEQLKLLFKEMLEFGDYDVLAVGPAIWESMGEEFFNWWQKEKEKRGIKARGIMGEQHITKDNVSKSTVKFKGVAGYDSVGSNFIFKDKLVNVIFSDNPVAVRIDNKAIAEGTKNQFEYLWNQDVQNYKGYDEVMNKFNTLLNNMKSGDEYYVLGGTIKDADTHYKDWFFDFHNRRIKAKKGIKILANPDHYQTIYQMNKELDPKMKLSAVKKLAPNLNNPMQINLYKPNTVAFFLWEKEIRCFTVESDLLFKNFKDYFDLLWKQDFSEIKKK